VASSSSSAPELRQPDSPTPSLRSPVPDLTRPGRPPALTPEKQSQLCEILRLGLSRTDAARILGTTVRTIYNHERHNTDFANAISQAQLDTDAKAYSSVLRAGEKSWRAAAWLIDHKSRTDRPPRRASAEAVLRSPAFQEKLRELICEAVVANEIRVDPGVIRRKKQLAKLRREIELRQRSGEETGYLQTIAHNLTREIAKMVRLTMRST
jgi:DNA-binding CsgD family transcriptional regulator